MPSKLALSNGVLSYWGTNGNNSIKFQQWGGWVGVQDDGRWFPASQVSSIVVHLQEGTDYVSLDSLGNGCSEALSPAVTINSGGGTKTVHLANGHDVSFSGFGNQLKVAANGGTVTLNGVVQTFNTPNPPTPPTPPPPPPPPPPSPGTNWFDTNITDAALRTLGHNLYVDNLIDRSDMIALLRNVEDGGVIDSTELADVRKIVAATALFGTQAHVQELASYIANGSAANAKYQGANLGNLGAGSSDAHLEKLINKWFLGLDRPNASDPYGMFNSYQRFTGQLFVSGATYDDVNQGAVGDCYFLAALAEAALRSNSTITNMFIVNGDGTYTVKFYGGGGVDYVTVDAYLPVNWAGNLYYATRGLELHQRQRRTVGSSGREGLRPDQRIRLEPTRLLQRTELLHGPERRIHLRRAGTRHRLVDVGVRIYHGADFTTFVNAWNAGKLIGFASLPTPPSGSGVVGGHAYAVIGYNAANQTDHPVQPVGTQQRTGPRHADLNLVTDSAELPILRSHGVIQSRSLNNPIRSCVGWHTFAAQRRRHDFALDMLMRLHRKSMPSFDVNAFALWRSWIIAHARARSTSI